LWRAAPRDSRFVFGRGGYFNKSSVSARIGRKTLLELGETPFKKASEHQFDKDSLPVAERIEFSVRDSNPAFVFVPAYERCPIVETSSSRTMEVDHA
jgi:hypothetical protein